MARCVIVIDDIGNGKVKVVATPNFETMGKMDLSGHTLTAAHGYALTALNAIRRASKDQKHQLRVGIPRLGLH